METRMIGTQTEEAGNVVTVENPRNGPVMVYFEGELRGHVLAARESRSFVAMSGVGSALWWSPCSSPPPGAKRKTVVLDFTAPPPEPAEVDCALALMLARCEP